MIFTLSEFCICIFLQWAYLSGKLITLFCFIKKKVHRGKKRATIRCSRKRIWVKKEFVWLLFYNSRNEKVTGGKNRRKWKTEPAKLESAQGTQEWISWFLSSGKRDKGLQGKKNSRWVTGATECGGALPPGRERNAGEMPSLPRWVGFPCTETGGREEQCWLLKACQAAHSGHNFGVQGQQMMRLKN